MQIPSPGADCPAIVRLPLRISNSFCKCIVPETVKSMVRAPPASTAARSVPDSGLLSSGLIASSKVETIYTVPPFPPVVPLPPPCIHWHASTNLLSVCGSFTSVSPPQAVSIANKTNTMPISRTLIFTPINNRSCSKVYR